MGHVFACDPMCWLIIGIGAFLINLIVYSVTKRQVFTVVAYGHLTIAMISFVFGLIYVLSTHEPADNQGHIFLINLLFSYSGVFASSLAEYLSNKKRIYAVLALSVQLLVSGLFIFFLGKL